ncbi:hypothetical protein [Streptomyces sp. NPDC047123]|uniref:hypothetical protein n=1 Tax=Streptomyces sp. NPDC047123 TaxID=3155622 RepID=UPI0033DBE9D1
MGIFDRFKDQAQDKGEDVAQAMDAEIEEKTGTAPAGPDRPRDEPSAEEEEPDAGQPDADAPGTEEPDAPRGRRPA